MCDRSRCKVIVLCDNRSQDICGCYFCLIRLWTIYIHAPNTNNLDMA